MTGLHFSPTLQMKNFLFRVSLNMTEGKTTYDGTFSNGDPITYHSPNNFQSIVGDVAFQSEIVGFSDLHLIPYVGFGYRHWNRGEANVETSYSTRKVEYSWLLLPVGLRSKYKISNRFTFGIDFSARIQLSGKFKSNYSGISPHYNDPEADLGKRISWLLQIPMQLKVHDRWFFSLAPWFEYFNIGRSNGVDLYSGDLIIKRIFEPDSKMLKYGFYSGVGFMF